MQLFGTPIKIHWSILIPLAITSLNFEYFMVLVLSFLLVTMHEFGHIFMSRRYGINCKKVVLSGIGGCAVLDGEQKTPGAEAIVAMAGPMVNIVLMLLGIGALYLYPIPAGPWVIFMFVNGFLVAFNAMPAFPMDGGRVFRAFLWKVTGNRLLATRIAVVTSVVLCLIGLVLSVMYVRPGLFMCSLVIAALAAGSWNESLD